MTWTARSADQLDWHWRNVLRPGLAGLTDDEYFGEPVNGCWTVHRDGAVRAGRGPYADCALSEVRSAHQP
ncbi:hypothetical protein MHEL_12440 [Mycolicibacterium helvum]|uniref:Uncharacterized protein n=1 Tax=Mycolicibacterium helvum TaxID=1534349 RepID=A0A7I7T3B5_9MYCO|nr:hypothetical protein MHEL_12440 [Mycolicibacterium helvum]